MIPRERLQSFLFKDNNLFRRFSESLHGEAGLAVATELIWGLKCTLASHCHVRINVFVPAKEGTQVESV